MGDLKVPNLRVTLAQACLIVNSYELLRQNRV